METGRLASFFTRTGILERLRVTGGEDVVVEVVAVVVVVVVVVLVEVEMVGLMDDLAGRRRPLLTWK